MGDLVDDRLGDGLRKAERERDRHSVYDRGDARGRVRGGLRVDEFPADSPDGLGSVELGPDAELRFERRRSAKSIVAPNSRNAVAARRSQSSVDDIGGSVRRFHGNVCHGRHGLSPF